MKVASSRPRRWLSPTVIVGLAVLAIAGVQLTDRIEGNFKFPVTLAVIFLMLLLLGLWLLAFSGYSALRRMSVLAAAVLCLIALGGLLKLATRVDGSVTGAGVPRLVWKWSPKPDAALMSAPVAGAPVDLSKTTVNDFPQFRGPHRNGILTGVALRPDWAHHPPRQLWRQPIGAGWSAFAVVGSFAVTQEQRGDEEQITCYDVGAGRLLWKHGNPVRFSETLGGDGPRATPTIVDGRVYAIGATGFLDCLDGGSGRVIWSRQVLKDAGSANLTWGKSCSPLVHDDAVIVSGGAGTGPSLMAFDKRSGIPLWRGGEAGAAYSSPTFADLAGKPQILIVNAESVTGHDAHDGHVLWEFAWPGTWPKASDPAPLDADRVFISAGYGLGCEVLKLSTDGSASLKVQPLWTSRNLKTQFTNVVVREGFVYGLDDGVLTCLDLSSGKRLWRDGRYGHGQILLVDDLLLVQAESGDVLLVRIGPDRHEELGRLAALSGKTWNNPALSGHKLLVRNDTEAACYELP